MTGLQPCSPYDQRNRRFSKYEKDTTLPGKRTSAPRQSKSTDRSKDIKTSSDRINDEDERRHFETVARETFGNIEIGRGIQNVLKLSRRMAKGAEAFGKPAVRRDKLVGMAKVARKLHAVLLKLDPATLIDAMGPRLISWDGNTDGNTAVADTELIPGASVSPSISSRAPILLHEYAAFFDRLGAVAAALDGLAKSGATARRGAPEVADALMFGIEGLASLWGRHKGGPPQIVGLKKGEFGDFVHQAMKTSSDVFPKAAVATALRRFGEHRRSKNREEPEPAPAETGPPPTASDAG